MTELYDLLEDWKVLWRFANGDSIFQHSTPADAQAFVTDREAFSADVEAVSNSLGDCLQASVAEGGITTAHTSAVEAALSHLWDHVAPLDPNPDHFNREEAILSDFEEVSRGALKWAVYFSQPSNK